MYESSNLVRATELKAGTSKIPLHGGVFDMYPEVNLGSRIEKRF